MVHIEQDQKVPENPNLRVLSETGDYDDNDHIECYDINNPGFALCAFTASFVAYGGIMYRFGSVEKLGEAILAIDPESSLDAVTFFKEEKARKLRQEMGDFSPENPAQVDKTKKPDPVPEPEPDPDPVDDNTNPVNPNTNPGGTTPPPPPPPPPTDNVSTTTPVSSTVIPIEEEIDIAPATTTIPALEIVPEATDSKPVDIVAYAKKRLSSKTTKRSKR